VSSTQRKNEKAKTHKLILLSWQCTFV